MAFRIEVEATFVFLLKFFSFLQGGSHEIDYDDVMPSDPIGGRVIDLFVGFKGHSWRNLH